MKETAQHASESVSLLIPAADENGHLAADLARVVVFGQVTTAITAVDFLLHDSDDK